MKLKLELDNKYECEYLRTDSYFKCHSQRDAFVFVYMREFDHINKLIKE